MSKPSFFLDLDAPVSNLPLPYNKERNERVMVPKNYPRFEVDFFDTITDCGREIDKINDRDERDRYNKELTKIFIIRHKPSVMRLFRELIDLTLTKKEHSHG